MSTEPIRRADAQLVADAQFGDSTAIEARILARYRAGLSVLSRRSLRYGDVLDALHREADDGLRPLLRDPVLCNAFEDDIACLEGGVFVESALGAFLAALGPRGAGDLGPCESLMTPHARPWQALAPSWVWTELRRPADRQAQADRLLELFRSSFEPGTQVEPIGADTVMLGALEQGAALLAALLPHVGPSVLSHVSLVGFADAESVDGSLQSLSGGDPLPSAMLLSPARLADPWLTAETLLHEAAHLKLFDALRSCSLVQDPEAEVDIPWRLTRWTFVRILVALHFYVHLLVFQEAVRGASPELRSLYGRPTLDETIDEPTPGSPAALDGTHRNSADRLVYLAEQALSADHGRLTAEGQRLVGWLLDCVEQVAPDVRGRIRVPAAGTDPVTVAVPAPFRPGDRLLRTPPTAVSELPAQQRLLVVGPDGAAFRWLDGHAWTIYALCDGRTLTEVEAGYEAACQGAVDGAAARRRVRACLDALTGAGLVSVQEPSLRHR